AVLGANAVATALPSRGVENLIGAVDVEFPLRVLRLDTRRRVEEVRGGDARPAVDLLLDRSPVDQEVERLAHGRVGEERVLRLDRRSLAVDLRPRVGLVDLDVLDVAAERGVDAPLSALLETLEDVVLHLHVPGVVVLGGLEHGARRGDGVAATLDLDLVEERPVGRVIARIELSPYGVTRLEVDKAIGPRYHRLQVRGSLRGLAALERLEEMLRNDHPRGAAEGRRPEGRRGLEDDLDGVTIHLVDARDVAVLTRRGGGCRRVRRVLPVEDHVVGGERL